MMSRDLIELLETIKQTPDFYAVEFSTINDTNALGDNALHCVCVWGDLAAAKLLIENGIDINQRGEGDFTPLNVALELEHQELANYLISAGADTSVIGAKFKYDAEKNREHLQGMAAEIKALEEKINGACAKK